MRYDRNMRRAIAHCHFARLAVLWTLLVALASGSLFAPGTMATRSANGALVIELCTPEGVSQVLIGADGQPVPSPDRPNDHAQPACAWAQAQAAQGWTPDTVPAPVVPQTHATAAVLLAPTLSPAQVTTKSTQSQAPPILL